MLVFIISWWMPLFIDRYFFFSSLSIPPPARGITYPRKKSGLWLLVYLIHLIIRLWFIS
ncbi:hypothetical protein SEEE1831_08447 [Salmonella enterica subsp. enterica serovar Enteritidis str. 13183-1]|nr:hypothetical protein SEEE1831_08447 [Salmonella enterica subsp. enterica serovar Enteritidis str. 13183-1]